MKENNVVKKKRTGLKIFLGILLVLVIAAAGIIFYFAQQEKMYEEKSKEVGIEYISKKVISEKAKNDPEIAKLEKEIFTGFGDEIEKESKDDFKMDVKFDENSRSFLIYIKELGEDGERFKYVLVDGEDAAGNEQDAKDLKKDWNELSKLFVDGSNLLKTYGIEKISFIIMNPYNEKRELLHITDGKVVYDYHNDIEKNKIN